MKKKEKMQFVGSKRRIIVVKEDDPVVEKKAKQEDSVTVLNMIPVVTDYKTGKPVYFGYMDCYFDGKPPCCTRNLVFDNKSLEVIGDLSGKP